MFRLNVEDNNDDVYTYETKPTLVITHLRMLHFTRYYKDNLQRRLMFWRHFVSNLSGYMYTNNYSNEERFDKVIAQTEWCSFFASRCMCPKSWRPFFSHHPLRHHSFMVLIWQ